MRLKRLTRILCPGIGIVVFFLILSIYGTAQTNSYSQFWNEFAFTRAFKGKWVGELDLGQTWSSTPENSNPFYVNSQLYVRSWIHFYATSRWKFSAFFSYYYNRAVPELSQKRLPELRMAYQATYYFHKVGYTLLGRLRIEDRKLRTEENIWEALYRFRTQIKFVKPINGKAIRKGVVYAIASDELYFKTGAFISGTQFFDRNRLTAGAGYAFNDDIQLEVTYVNEYLPRDGTDEMYHAFQVNVSINNFFPNIKKKLFNRNEPLDHE
ncbi:DUF2490 domain-containing protein [Pollutibacter soli]|uniref:DUF2490 domain-containing protein n=1 Tax=Pollutibacter soli TaxID=3034157 RepID=UPI003013426C